MELEVVVMAGGDGCKLPELILKHSGKGTKVDGAQKACNWMQGIGMTINLNYRLRGTCLLVGVSKPFSMVNGSATKVMDLANSKPLNCITISLSKNNKYENRLKKTLPDLQRQTTEWSTGWKKSQWSCGYRGGVCEGAYRGPHHYDYILTAFGSRTKLVNADNEEHTI
ncbi:hypothetical protein LXL04_020398 [Taraxacum kok-saghyz]